MDKRLNLSLKSGGLAMLMSVVSFSAQAKEGEAHMPGISRLSDEHWVQRIAVSGLLEAEYGATEDFSGKKSSDITVSTVELAFDAAINQKIDAHLSFVHEEDETTFELDEAYIDSNFFQVGQMYVPFGLYATNMISDPLTLEISETRESVIRVGGGIMNLYASVYIFKGTTRKTGAEKNVDQAGGRINYFVSGAGFELDLGVDYINNLDSEAVIAHLQAKTPSTNELHAYVPARLVYASLRFGGMHVIAEQLSTDQYDAIEIAFNGNGAKLGASNIELGYSMAIAGIETTLGVARQTTEQAQALGLAKEKTLLAVSLNIYEETALSFEYASSTDYALADGGTGKDATSYTVQLAVGF